MHHTFEVHGMTCSHCEKAVTQAIHRLEPQASVHIDRGQHSVTVRAHHPLDLSALQQAIQAQGYEVRA